MLRRVFETVLGGLVIAVVLVLAGCQEAVAPTAAAAAEHSIVGEWTVTEYVDRTRETETETRTLSGGTYPPPLCPAGWTSVRTWHTEAPSGGSYQYHRECQPNLADEHDITMTFTADTWVLTFDPPLPGVSEAGAAAVIGGRYELLSDSRVLITLESPLKGQVVTEYVVRRTTLRFTMDGKRWMAARQM